jgi:hypothetical protein
MKKGHLSKLMEAELDKAETILAVKELGDKIQDQAEDIAKMRVDTLMPLTEKIKEQFGQETGTQFQSDLDGLLEGLQNSLIDTKNQIDNKVAVLNGDAPDTASDMDIGGDFDSDMDLDADTDNDIDIFGADDAAAGGNEPLGRMRKESVDTLRRNIRVLEKKLEKFRK